MKDSIWIHCFDLNWRFKWICKRISFPWIISGDDFEFVGDVVEEYLLVLVKFWIDLKLNFLSKQLIQKYLKIFQFRKGNYLSLKLTLFNFEFASNVLEEIQFGVQNLIWSWNKF
jgi:hypothetical protein